MSLEIIDFAQPIDRRLTGAVVALTALDNINRGHERHIALAASKARQFGAPLIVVSFAPDRQDEGPDAALRRLMTPAQQARVLERLGVEAFCALPFDAHMAGLADDILTRRLLAQGLAARHVMIGGDIAQAVSARFASVIGNGAGYGYSVFIPHDACAAETDLYARGDAKAALRSGRPDLARQIMGRPFAIEGVVVEGQRLGRQLGFPTANIMAGEYVRPRLGAYATVSRLGDGRELPGVANFGVNPTTGLAHLCRTRDTLRWVIA